jgi:hypothetical protein
MSDSIVSNGEQVPRPSQPAAVLILAPAPALLPARLFTPTPKAAKRVLEFFTAQVNNPHTRRAYLNATRRFTEDDEAL